MRVLLLVASLAAVTLGDATAREQSAARSLLDDHLLVTWYGNPRSASLGVLGESAGGARAAALLRQARAYAGHTQKQIAMAYHLIASVAQCTPGADGLWRRRESRALIEELLEEARANGFRLVLDVQPGRSSVDAEVAVLERFLAEPDVDLALDPEWQMGECEVPGKQIGHLRAVDINAAVDRLEALVRAHELPPKILIVHQFRLDMLPDKARIRRSPAVRLVLDMDGFGSQTLKLSSYRAIMRQGPLDFAGIKLFYRQDTGIFSPREVMSLVPIPSVVVYQ